MNFNQVLHGDIFDIVPTLPAKTVHAVITSPPYALQRQKQYGGVTEDDYPAWTVRWMEAIRRVLVDDGNVAIVISPHLREGELSDYVLHTRLALREAGWIECQELVWIKPTSPPLGHIGRPRRSWESILWFSRSREPFCNPLANGSLSDRLGLESVKGMGDYLHDREMRETYAGIARCRDYIEVATNQANKDDFNTHPAQFPERLAGWLIRLLCPRDGVVCDPFAGSGTSLVAAKRARYVYFGCDINEEYVQIARQRLDAVSTVAEDYFRFAPQALDSLRGTL